MKFSELQFKTRDATQGDTQAVVFFPNGHGASIITGSLCYTNKEKPYELAVLCGDEMDCYICYHTEITNDVIGWQTEHEIEKLLERIEALPKTRKLYN